MSNDLADDIVEALRSVIDLGFGDNIADHDLHYGVVIEEDRVRLLLISSTAERLVTDDIGEAAAGCAAEIDGAASVDVQITWDPSWSPERMRAAN